MQGPGSNFNDKETPSTVRNCLLRNEELFNLHEVWTFLNNVLSLTEDHNNF